jgi:HEAT repeat protein
VKELVTAMSSWWGKSYDQQALEGMYGKPDGNPLLATLYLGKPHEQATAIATLGDARSKPAVPFLVPLATHSTPIVRYYVIDALAKILDTAPSANPAPIDLHRDDATIAQATRAWVEARGVVLPK